jgi:SAM-dependent methyltransferase
MNENYSVRISVMPKVWRSLDRYLGRGSYYWLRAWIDPQREYTQLTYARWIGDVLTPQTRWLDAGGGHRAIEVTQPDIELALVRRVRLAVCCDQAVHAIAKHRSIRVKVGAALEHLPFRSGSIGLITLNNVVEHLERPQEVFLEFARVLAPQGRLIVHTPNISSYAMRLVEIGRRILPEPLVMKMIRYMDFREEEDVFPTYYRANTRAELGTAARLSGLSLERILLVPARPLFYFVAPLCAAELAAGRLMLRLGAENFAASVILGMFRKPA